MALITRFSVNHSGCAQSTGKGRGRPVERIGARDASVKRWKGVSLADGRGGGEGRKKKRETRLPGGKNSCHQSVVR